MLYVVIFALCVAACEQRIDYSNGKVKELHSPIALAFASIGAISCESSLNSWAKIDSAADQQELDRITSTVLNSLGLTDAGVKSQALPGKASRECQVEQPHSRLKVVIEADYQNDSTAIIFTYRTTDTEYDPARWVSWLENINGWDWHHYYLYQAYLPEAAEQQQQEEFLHTVMQSLDARVKEAYIDERVISLSGYSQVLGDMVIPEWVGNRQVNVQAAIRHQTDGKAVIMIGSPFILADY